MNGPEDYNLMDNALLLALLAHGGARDRGRASFILHPLRIMARMDTEDLKAVALLHDVIEDSSLTAEDLLDHGIPKHIVDAVVCLTRVEGENYDDYIDMKVMSNQLSIIVKMADIEDNINILRLETITKADYERVTKYHRNWLKLKKVREDCA